MISTCSLPFFNRSSRPSTAHQRRTVNGESDSGDLSGHRWGVSAGRGHGGAGTPEIVNLVFYLRIKLALLLLD
jgi:hypothetical protein